MMILSMLTGEWTGVWDTKDLQDCQSTRICLAKHSPPWGYVSAQGVRTRLIVFRQTVNLTFSKKSSMSLIIT